MGSTRMDFDDGYGTKSTEKVVIKVICSEFQY